MIAIELDILQKVFDIATESMDFGSGFLDNEEVEALRACARALGVDPAVATPGNFKCQYEGHEEPWQARPYRNQHMVFCNRYDCPGRAK